MIWWYYDDDSMGIDTILLQYWYQLNQNGGQNDGKMWANICCIGNVLEHIWNIIWNSYEIMNIMSVSMEHLMTIWWTYDEHCMKFVWTLLRHVATRSMAPKFPHARPEKLGGGSLAGQFIRNNGRYAEGAISQSWWVFFYMASTAVPPQDLDGDDDEDDFVAGQSPTFSVPQRYHWTFFKILISIWIWFEAIGIIWNSFGYELNIYEYMILW